jgi:hypothetical protein
MLLTTCGCANHAVVPAGYWWHQLSGCICRRVCMQPRALHDSSWGRWVKRMVFEVFFVVVFQVRPLQNAFAVLVHRSFVWTFAHKLVLR